MSLTIEYPSFNHPEVIAFYEHDLSIPKEKVEQILQLPRETLIQDMETILMDTIKRDEFFQNYPDEDHWWSQNFHALWVLVELEAEESLPTVLQLLQQKPNYAWHWFGDYMTEGFWEILYYLGGQQLEAFKKVVLRAGNWSDRIMPATMIAQIALHQPERRDEAIEWYRSILESFLAMDEGEEALQADVISSIISHSISFQAKELIPQIRAVNDKKLLDPIFAGDLKAVENYLEEGSGTSDKEKLYSSIFERYGDAMQWISYQERYNEDYKARDLSKTSNSDLAQLLSSDPLMVSNPSVPSSISSPVETVKREDKKVGRNDPCPCGSGKKYKKCCLRK